MKEATVDGRQSRDDYFMSIAQLVKTRSVCIRKQVGAVLVKDQHIIATGYNGPPKGLEHCVITGCIRKRLGIAHGTQQEVCRGLHAEQNALIQAALHGTPCGGSTIYITHSPCNVCVKMLINADVKRIFYCQRYPDDLGLKMLAEAGIEAIRWDEQNEQHD